ncbi:HNH endonuclease [Ureibacillus xyleni]|uniref:Putative HNH nuclease YajD n=1 Tax=Ureibacillus xyleni TaxID=614648 RepID=A0A285SXU4_9BACL|nr:HNH endonuclease [Ureibacillus xyleni]SOC12870.1 HNH endonuclease [Ureibacillus xyleni]
MTLEHTALAKKFYKSKAWKKTRDAYFKSQHGLCERCGEAGLIVHHKVWIDIDNINNPDVTLDWNNLEVVCVKCHNQEHFKKNDGVPEGCMFDEDGNLIYLGE